MSFSFVEEKTGKEIALNLNNMMCQDINIIIRNNPNKECGYFACKKYMQTIKGTVIMLFRSGCIWMEHKHMLFEAIDYMWDEIIQEYQNEAEACGDLSPEDNWEEGDWDE